VYLSVVSYVDYSLLCLGDIYQRRPVEAGGRGGVGQSGRPRTGGRPSTGRPETAFLRPGKTFFGCFGSPYWSPTAPRGSQYILVRIVFTLYTVRIELGSAKRTMLDRGGSKTSVFARTFLMDDSLFHFIHPTYSQNMYCTVIC